MSVDPWDFYNKTLAGEKPTPHEDDPQQCYFRRRRGKTFIPGVIWWHPPRDENGELEGDQKLMCLVGFGEEPADPYEEWVGSPALEIVEHKHYLGAIETGRWHDDPPLTKVRGGIGDNLPDDPVASIEIEIAGEEEIVAEFLAIPVTTQDVADRVGPWWKRIDELAKRADSLREEEKRPHLEACRDVDDKWRHAIAKARELVRALKDHIKPFLDAQRLAEQQRARKAAEEAQRLREEATKKTSEADRDELQRQAADAERQAVPHNAAAGRVGAKVALKTYRQARVTDYKVAAGAMLDANNSDLKREIDRLAQRAATAGITLPGVEVTEETRAV